jgi:hypothetical protein
VDVEVSAVTIFELMIMSALNFQVLRFTSINREPPDDSGSGPNSSVQRNILQIYTDAYKLSFSSSFSFCMESNEH